MTARADEPRAEAEAIDSVDLRVGAEVGAYAIVRLVGRGGMGAVYEARHTRLGRRFAVKFLLPELAARPEIIRRFENEAVAAGALEHPNLVVVTDLGRAADGAPFIVMEYLDGEDCAHLLHRVGPLPAPRAAELVLQACRGVAVAHAGGTIHRDLKPENLFLTKAGDGGDLVKVLDFGVAKLRPAPDKLGDGKLGTRTGATLGTAHYMSPEQARGAAEVDVRTDVWALGVVLYELLGGRRPFEGDDFLNVVHQILSVDAAALGALRPGLPAGLEAVVARAMRKDPAERYPSVTALAEALQPFAGRAVAPRAVSSPTAATIETTGVGSAPARRPTWTSARVGTILAMAALTVGALLFIGGRAPAKHAPAPPPATTTAEAQPAAPSVPTTPEAPAPAAPPVIEVGGPARKPDDRPTRARPTATATDHARPAARAARGLALEPNPY